jgi:hypothetical protein
MQRVLDAAVVNAEARKNLEQSYSRSVISRDPDNPAGLVYRNPSR